MIEAGEDLLRAATIGLEAGSDCNFAMIGNPVTERESLGQANASSRCECQRSRSHV